MIQTPGLRVQDSVGRILDPEPSVTGETVPVKGSELYLFIESTQGGGSGPRTLDPDPRAQDPDLRLLGP